MRSADSALRLAGLEYMTFCRSFRAQSQRRLPGLFEQGQGDAETAVDRLGAANGLEDEVDRRAGFMQRSVVVTCARTQLALECRSGDDLGQHVQQRGRAATLSWQVDADHGIAGPSSSPSSVAAATPCGSSVG